ncbi:MAG: translation elongation factor Ts [Bacteroidia bacterium]
MATITAQDVNKLRTITGAGMMDCKKALTECDGDFEKAIDYLRKKGQKVAANRSDREAKEGAVIAKVTPDGKKGAIVMVNCETDFVAKNQEFIDFTSSLVDIALTKNCNTVEELKAAAYNSDISVADKIMEMVGKIGEKIEIGAFEIVTAEKVTPYIHHGNRLATLVGFSKTFSDEQVGKNIAMQVAAMNPIAIDRNSVDAATLERELDIAREQTRAEGKPEDMVEKIAQGKLNKFFKESTLIEQEFIVDNKKSVGQYLQSVDKDLTVTSFKRVSLN